MMNNPEAEQPLKDEMPLNNISSDERIVPTAETSQQLAQIAVRKSNQHYFFFANRISS